MKKRRRAQEQLKRLETKISQLGDGPEKLKLELEIHKATADFERVSSVNWSEWVRMLGTFVVAFGGLVALFLGIEEYRHSREQRQLETEQREIETLASALQDFTDSQSASRRASGMTVLPRFLDSEKYRTRGSKGELSVAQRIIFVMSLQIVEETSPALRLLLVGYLTSRDEEEKANALLFLTISNQGLLQEAKMVPLEEGLGEKLRQLKLVSQAMNTLVGYMKKEIVSDVFREVLRETKEKSLAISLEGMDLRGYSFESVNLSGSVFRNSSFSSTDFAGADISGVDMKGATFDKETSVSLCQSRDWRKAKFDGARRSLLARTCQ